MTEAQQLQQLTMFDRTNHVRQEAVAFAYPFELESVKMQRRAHGKTAVGLAT